MTLTPSMHLEQLKATLKAYHERIRNLEDKKYDIEYIVKRKDVEVQSSLHNKNQKNTEHNKKLKHLRNAPIALPICFYLIHTFFF